MQLHDIEDGNSFDELCKALLLAAHGEDLVLVQDESGDGGLDAFVRSTGTLYACYCPGVRTAEDTILGKGRRDLTKAVRLRDELGYAVRSWRMITPRDLPEPQQRGLRDRAAKLGIQDANCLGKAYVRDLWLRHTHVHPYFPQFQTPEVLALVRDIRAHQLAEPAKFVQPPSQAGPPPVADQPEPAPPRKPQPPGEEVQRLRGALARGIAHAPAEFARLRVISAVGDTVSDQLWATLSVLEVLNAIEHAAEIRAISARLSMLSQASGLPHFEVLADAKLAELLNFTFVVADMYTANALHTATALGLTRSEVSGPAVDVERVRRLQRDADALLDPLLSRASALGDSRVMVAVLDTVAEARQRRFELYSAFHPGSDLATSERSRALWAYGAQLDLARALCDVTAECVALHHYSRALHLAGDSTGPALASRALVLIERHAIAVPPGAWAEIQTIAAGGRPAHWPPIAVTNS